MFYTICACAVAYCTAKRFLPYEYDGEGNKGAAGMWVLRRKKTAVRPSFSSKTNRQNWPERLFSYLLILFALNALPVGFLCSFKLSNCIFLSVENNHFISGWTVFFLIYLYCYVNTTAACCCCCCRCHSVSVIRIFFYSFHSVVLQQMEALYIFSKVSANWFFVNSRDSRWVVCEWHPINRTLRLF